MNGVAAGLRQMWSLGDQASCKRTLAFLLECEFTLLIVVLVLSSSPVLSSLQPPEVSAYVVRVNTMHSKRDKAQGRRPATGVLPLSGKCVRSYLSLVLRHICSVIREIC